MNFKINSQDQDPMNTSTFNLTKTEAFVWLLAFVAPITAMMWATVILIVVDFITGVSAAIKTKTALSSGKLYSTVSKFLIYLMVILAAHAFEQNIVQVIPMTQIVGGFIGLTELKSIFENFNKIYGIDLWEQLKEFFKKKNITDTLDPNKSPDFSPKDSSKSNQNSNQDENK